METYQVILIVFACAAGALYIAQRLTGFHLMEKVIQWKPV